MKIYRIAMTMREDGYVEVEAENEAEAFEKAEQENEAGGFVGYKSECSIGEIIEEREMPRTQREEIRQGRACLQD